MFYSHLNSLILAFLDQEVTSKVFTTTKRSSSDRTTTTRKWRGEQALVRMMSLFTLDRFMSLVCCRHHLLRMQKEMRAQSAREKRQLLELRKREHRKHLRGHQTCDESPRESPCSIRDVTSHNPPHNNNHVCLSSCDATYVCE